MCVASLCRQVIIYQFSFSLSHFHPDHVCLLRFMLISVLSQLVIVYLWFWYLVLSWYFTLDLCDFFSFLCRIYLFHLVLFSCLMPTPPALFPHKQYIWISFGRKSVLRGGKKPFEHQFKQNQNSVQKFLTLHPFLSSFFPSLSFSLIFYFAPPWHLR